VGRKVEGKDNITVVGEITKGMGKGVVFTKKVWRGGLFRELGEKRH